MSVNASQSLSTQGISNFSNLPPLARVTSQETNQGNLEPVQNPPAEIKTIATPHLREEYYLKLASTIRTQNEENLLEILKKIPIKHSAIFITQIEKLRGITLFILSMFVRKKELSKELFERLKTVNLLGKMIPQRDASGWTAVHHAAFLDTEIYKLLKRLPEAASLKTPFATSPSMLRKICYLSKNNLSDDNYQIYVRLPGNQVDTLMPASEVVRLKDFFNIPCQHFSALTYFPMSAINVFWKNCNPEEKLSNGHQSFIEYLQTLNGVERNLALRMTEHNDAGEKLDVRIGIGVFAKRPIKAGQVLGSYGGIVVGDPFSFGSYKISFTSNSAIDGEIMRSFGSMLNHSFPNAEFRTVTVNGIKHVIVIALRDINEGEEICASYGDGYYPALSSSVELRPRAMERFVRDHPLKEFMAWCENPGTEEPTGYRMVSQWNYIIHDMPVRLLQLILRGSIPLAEAQMLYDKFKLIIDGNENNNILVQFAYAFLKKIELGAFELCLSLVKNKPERGPKIADQLTRNGYSRNGLQAIVDGIR